MERCKNANRWRSMSGGYMTLYIARTVSIESWSSRRIWTLSLSQLSTSIFLSNVRPIFAQALAFVEPLSKWEIRRKMLNQICIHRHSDQVKLHSVSQAAPCHVRLTNFYLLQTGWKSTISYSLRQYPRQVFTKLLSVGTTRGSVLKWD